MPIPEIQDLVDISRFAGADLLLAQGGGGNTSVKSADGTRMWIKASGVRLAEVAEGSGYLEIDVPALRALMQDRELAARPRAEAHIESVRRTQAAAVGAGPVRPSLETGFHATLGRVVLHTHPVYVNAFACQDQGEAALAEAFSQSFVWVPYAPPGYALGVEVERACTRHRQAHGQLPQRIILGQHGLIASAPTGAEAIALTRELTQTGQDYFGPLPVDACARATPPEALTRWAEGLQTELQPHFPTIAVRATTRATLLGAAAAPERWLTAGPLVPDDVVYGGAGVWRAEGRQAPADWLRSALPDSCRIGKMLVAVEGLGVVLAGPHLKFLEAMEENLLAHVLVRQLIARRGGCARALPPDEVDYLLSMESEHYRQAVAAGGA